MTRIFNVQALRAVAALMVALAHLKVPLPIINNSHTAPLTHGQAGVDIFFVISGFIMAFGVLERSDTPGSFMRRRLLRIAPLYWAMTAVVFVLALAAPRLFPQVHVDATHLLKSLFFIPHEYAPIVYVGWTLNYEMFFYCVFAAALVLGGRWRFVMPVSILAVLVGAGLGIDLKEGSLAAFLTNPILLEFAAGIGLALVWRSFASLGAGVWIVLLAGAFAAIYCGPYAAERDIRLLAWGIPSILIVAAALGLEGRGVLANQKLLQLAGDASYSIYLTHIFVTRAYEKFPIGVDLSVRPVVAGLVALAMLGLVTLVGIMTHKLIEIPLGHAAARIFARRRRSQPAVV